METFLPETTRSSVKKSNSRKRLLFTSLSLAALLAIPTLLDSHRISGSPMPTTHQDHGRALEKAVPYLPKARVLEKAVPYLPKAKVAPHPTLKPDSEKVPMS